MTHVHGVDDGIGYGVSFSSSTTNMRAISSSFQVTMLIKTKIFLRYSYA